MSTRIGSGCGTRETSSQSSSAPAAPPVAQGPVCQAKPAAPPAQSLSDGVDAAFVYDKRYNGGAQTELFGTSAHLNWDQVTLEGAALKGEWKSSGGAVKLSGDGLSFRANLGLKNADGSFGNNIGFSANIVGAEGTWNFPGGNGFTAGVSAGVGAEVSTGVRDIDQDGKPELCVRVSVLAVTGGGCFEELVP